MSAGLGGEEPEAEADLAAVAPASVALALDQAQRDPQATAETIAFLKSQRRLSDIQAEHLHEQRALLLQHLRVRRWRERLQLALQVFVAAAGTALALLLILVLADAFASRQVVVEAFDAPPTLAARGLNGKVVAAAVLDKLKVMQAATRTVTKGLNASAAWASDIHVEVPETGISIGEILRLLRQRFGHDLHIGGDVVQTPDGGLALTIRGDGVPARTFTGGAGDLELLASQAAEYAYSAGQPQRYVSYLIYAGRPADAAAAIPLALGQVSSDVERARLYKSWATALSMTGQEDLALVRFRQSMALAAPRSDVWWLAWANMINQLSELPGREEIAWREAHAFVKEREDAIARGRDAPELRLAAIAATVAWDYPLNLLGVLADARYYGGRGTSISTTAPPSSAYAIADAYRLLHDYVAAARAMTAADPTTAGARSQQWLLDASAALDRGDPGAAVAPLRAYWDAAEAQSPSLSVDDYACLYIEALGLSGRPAEAFAVASKIGPYARCFAALGDAYATAGDLANARRTWDAGLRLAPDLPIIYLRRGIWEAAHGDPIGAAADFSTATLKAPHFADPYKAWADLLAGQGRWREALAKYDEALKYAPAWTQLHAARAAAAHR
jgi:tetratricopeptide (TPR) repeat protein